MGDVAMRFVTWSGYLSLLVAFLWSVLLLPAGHAADPHGPAFTDPHKAGVDYDLQGEYSGEHVVDGEKRKLGVQVIALGEGKFRAVGYIGGLPGEGWTRGGEIRTTEGELQDGSVKFMHDNIVAELKGGMITVTADGNKIAELARLNRQSPTLGAKAPAGAVVLFDGSSADAFEKGKIVEEDLLAANGCVSKQKFGDHTLHIEFRTPFMPQARGQARGNSGVYAQGRYEIQVLDSFGLEGKNNECGGIYSIAEPKVNMCFPPLTWQTYDIDFTAARYDDAGKKTKNARVTVKHNGVVIHDDVELTHGTPGHQPEGPGPESLYLQDHGNPVVFRNIWVVEKKEKS
jgi:hypothetical protein